MSNDDETVERVAILIANAMFPGKVTDYPDFDPVEMLSRLNAAARAALSALPERELLREALEALSEAASIFDAIKRHGGTISQQVHTFASGPRTEAKEAWAFPKWMLDELDIAETDARTAADKIRAALTQEPQK